MQIVRILSNNLVVNFFECLLSVYKLKYASFKEIKNNIKEYLSKYLSGAIILQKLYSFIFYQTFLLFIS